MPKGDGLGNLLAWEGEGKKEGEEGEEDKSRGVVGSTERGRESVSILYNCMIYLLIGI